LTQAAIGITESRIFYLQNAGSQTTTGNFLCVVTAGTAHLTVVVVEYSGLVHSSSNDKDVTNSGLAGNPVSASSGTLAKTNELVVVGIGWASAGTAITPTNGFVIVAQVQDLGTINSAFLEKIVTSNAATSSGVTVGSASWVANLGSFKRSDLV